MLFKNIDILDENFNYIKNCYVGVCGNVIDYVGKDLPQRKYNRHYNGKGKLLMPGLVNAHSHASMTLLRGYAENMKLSDWLHLRIFPFEAKLSGDDIYNGAMLGFAEMLRFGVVSVTDMYFMGDYLAKAVLDTGIKCNMSIGITCLDDRNYYDLPVFKENNHLIKEYHNIENERLKVDMSIHAEYTSSPKVVRQIAEFACDKDLRMHIHLSETKEEHEECKQRHQLTPAQYFNELGIFNKPTTAAHCIWLEKEDYDIIKEKNVTVACCPISNLKLASGFCNVPLLLDKGINVALGTDGAASNNSLNIFEDIKFFALIYKAAFNNVTAITPNQSILAATKSGAISQGRDDCGTIKVGNRADVIVLDIDQPWMMPNHNIKNNITYSAQGSDVILTMVDGKVLYENGQYLSLDIEKVLYNAKKSTDSILNKL
jgi:5-methylthioadenosine/S-adenosylhomocysteine deaminase